MSGLAVPWSSGSRDRRSGLSTTEPGESRLEQLAGEIAIGIIQGGLPPGSFLPVEHRLAQQHEVSRPTIREALRRLAAAGLVETRHGVGSYVNPPSRWNLFDPLVLRAYISSGNLPAIVAELVELRRIVEVECAGLSAERITPDQLQQLKQWLERMDVSLTDPDAFAHADVAYHGVIIEASGNRFLQGVIRYLAEPLSEGRRLTARTGGEKGLAQAQRWHREIYAAIAARDPERAREAMRMHIEQSEGDLKRALLAVAPPSERTS